MLTERGAAATAALWWLGAALLYLGFGYTEMMGSDLWWHLAAGREMLQEGSIRLRDAWSFTARGEHWVNHAWLADLVFHGWSRAFGVDSLVYWKWLVLLATYLGLQQVLFRGCGERAAAVLGAALALVLAAPFLDLRPHLYSLAGTVALLALLLGRRAPRWQLCALFLLWVNLHGGYIFGLLVLAILRFPWGRADRRALGDAALDVGLCAAACLLNPEGYRVFLLPLVYAFSDSPYRTLGEWLSPFVDGGIRSPGYFIALPLAAVLAALRLLPAVRRRVDVPAESLALCLLTMAMSMTSRRFIPLFGIAFALLATPFLAALVRLPVLRPARPALAVAVLGIGLARLAPMPLAAGPAFHYLAASYAYPHDLMDWVMQAGLRGRTFAYYNWGGYLHWRSDGALAVFIDGRANTLYDAATYRQYLRVARAGPGWTAVVRDSGADFFLWPAATAGGSRLLGELWDSGDWQLAYEGGNGVLLARRELALPEPPAPRPSTANLDITRARQALRRGELAAAERAARRAREQRPWDRNACAALAQALRRQQRGAEADAVIADCRDYFPTRYLR